jgi:hypothetical protein
MDRAMPIPQILVVHLLDGLQVIGEGLLEARRQHGHAVLGSFAVSDQDLVQGEVDILDPQAEPFRSPSISRIPVP